MLPWLMQDTPRFLAFQLGDSVSYADHSIDATTYYLGKLRILFNEEAEADILNEDHDSGAWYLDMQTGEVSFY